MSIHAPPQSGIWFWYYTMGLKGVKWDDIDHHSLPDRYRERYASGALYRNYLSGKERSSGVWLPEDPMVRRIYDNKLKESKLKSYDQYEEQTYVSRLDRFVPCIGTRPLVKWSEVKMTRAEAIAYPNSQNLAENLYATNMIAIDIDGAHGDIYLPVIKFGYSLLSTTQARLSPKTIVHNGQTPSTSMHLVYYTDRIIPTMHFASRHIDICGNARNQIIYHKDKKFVGEISHMTSDIWDKIVKYIKEEGKA